MSTETQTELFFITPEHIKLLGDAQRANDSAKRATDKNNTAWDVAPMTRRAPTGCPVHLKYTCKREMRCSLWMRPCTAPQRAATKDSAELAYIAMVPHGVISATPIIPRTIYSIASHRSSARSSCRSNRSDANRIASRIFPTRHTRSRQGRTKAANANTEGRDGEAHRAAGQALF